MPRPEKYWTIPQTLLWIITRDLERVSAVPDTDKDNILLTLSGVFKGHDDPISISLNQDFQESLSDFKHAASNEDIRTYGKKDNDSSHQIIHPIEWRGLVISGVRGNLKLQAGSKTVWQSAFVEKTDAVRAWPPYDKNTQKSRGREIGDGAYRDEGRLVYMHEIISSGDAKSVYDAAKKAVTKFGQNGASYESDVDRLRKKYSTIYQP